MPAPSPSPAEKTLARVLLISVVDGWSIVGFAVVGLLITLFLGDLSGMVVGVLVGVAGVMEIRGHSRLKRRQVTGMSLLIRSQLLLLGSILVYCAMRLGSFDEDTMLAGLTPDMAAVLREYGLEQRDIVPLVRMAFYGVYGGLAVGTVLYQGGMTLYYRSRISAVTDALATPPPPPRPRVPHLPPSA